MARLAMNPFLLILLMVTATGLGAAEWKGLADSFPAAALKIRQVDNPGKIGDIYVIQAPDGKTTLVDTGWNSTGESVLIPALERFDIHHIDQVIITHQHDDHIGGLPALLADPELDVGQILWSPIPDEYLAKYAPAEYQNELPYSQAALAMAARRRIPVRALQLGETLDFGGGVTGEVLAVARPETQVRSYVNNNSVVFRLKHGDFSMLFVGDQEREEEEWLLASGAQIASDTLKVGHHGGNGSTCPHFLDAVNPKVAVVTSPEWVASMPLVVEVTGMLKERGIPYFRSWEYGTLTIWSDGKAFGIVLEN